METENNQMKDLVGFLSDPNPKVKLETLSVILQYSATENQREQFYDTDLVKSVLHLHSDEEYAERAISVLINFSQDEKFQQQIVDKKAIQRIIETMKDQLIKHTDLIAKGMTKEQLNVSDKSLKHSADDDKRFTEDQLILVIQLELLFLSNLSLNDDAKEQILEFHREPEFHGLHYSFMLNWFSHRKIGPLFHFFANILANLTSQAKCREFLLEPKQKLFENITTSIYSADPNRRLGTLKTLRNCFFEYENENVVNYILDPQYTVLDSLLKCLAYVLTQILSVVENADKFYEQGKDICKDLKVDILNVDEIPNLPQSMEETDIILDIYVVLTNLDPEKTKIEMDEATLKKLLGLVTKVTSKEEIQNKIDVIKVLILKEGPVV